MVNSNTCIESSIEASQTQEAAKQVSKCGGKQSKWKEKKVHRGQRSLALSEAGAAQKGVRKLLKEAR